MNKPIILITNDDGITAPGIKNLIEVASQFGDVVVVAPDKPQSGMGHAITLNNPIRLTEVDIFPNIKAYQCTGTPVDCVKIAVDKVLHRKPDLCLSGINHGANHSINVIYSGTMSAAMEGAIENIPSVGFSLLDFSYNADFSLSRKVVAYIIDYMLKNKLPDHSLLNVNIPNISLENFKGIIPTKQAKAKWKEHFIEREDPMNKKYFWLTGEFDSQNNNELNDDYYLKQGYATLVPQQFDLTNYQLLSLLQNDKNFIHE